MTAVASATRALPDAHARGTLLLAAGMVLASALGLLAAINPIFGLGAFAAVIAIAAFTRNGAVAVCAFASSTYFDLVSAYTGAALSPVKIAGGSLICVAALTLAVRTRRSSTEISTDPVARMLAGSSPGWRDHPVLVALLVAFVAWAITSAAWAVNLEQVRTLGTRLVTDALTFLAVPVFVQRTRHLRMLGWTILASAVGAAMLGWLLGAQVVGRALGTFTDPNEYAAALVPALALGLALGETSRTAATRWAGRIGAGISLLALLQSGSRGGMLAIVVAFGVLLFTARGGERVRMTGALALVIALGLAYVTMTPTGGGIAARVTDSDSSGRTDLWKVAVRQFQDEPVHGVGLGNYPALSRHYLQGDVDNLELFLRDPRVVHSTPLELLAELGAVGTFLYAAFVAACLGAGMSAVRGARQLGDARLTGVARGILAATAAVLSTMIFLSGQYQELAWVLLAACVASRSIVRRELALADTATVLDGDLLEDPGTMRAPA